MSLKRCFDVKEVEGHISIKVKDINHTKTYHYGAVMSFRWGPSLVCQVEPKAVYGEKCPEFIDRVFSLLKIDLERGIAQLRNPNIKFEDFAEHVETFKGDVLLLCGNM